MSLAAEPRVVPPGEEVLPGYRVEALLARGGRVDTYDVTDLERDCRAVVKVVRPDRAHEPRIREALATEGRLLTELTHPHLVRGYGLAGDGLVLETVPGRTLAAVVDDGTLTASDTALLGRQLVSVLGYLHRQGWLHLDVKPENLVVQEGRIVLIDLGLAAPPGVVRRAIGTEGYAAPEQDGGTHVGPAADVWGLGATLYEALVSSAPGRDADLRVVPAALRELVADCLRIDPATRPTTTELASRLDALLADPPSAYEPLWLKVTSTLLRRR
jgi:eukaryotic-like serine/threonine-protein kinase